MIPDHAEFRSAALKRKNHPEIATQPELKEISTQPSDAKPAMLVRVAKGQTQFSRRLGKLPALILR